MEISTSITFSFASAENATIFYQSFLPEYKDMPMKRSQWQMHPPQAGENLIQFDITATDVTAFRATLNSLIQFAGVVERTLQLLEKS